MKTIILILKGGTATTVRQQEYVILWEEYSRYISDARGKMLEAAIAKMDHQLQQSNPPKGGRTIRISSPK